VLGCGGSLETDVRTRSGPTIFNGISARFTLVSGTVAPLDAGPSPVNFLFVDVYDSADWCNPADGGTPEHPFSRLELSLSKPQPTLINAGSHPLSDSTVGAVDGWLASFAHINGVSGVLNGTSGQLELERLTSDVAEGSLDLVLQDGTRIEGPFLA